MSKAEAIGERIRSRKEKQTRSRLGLALGFMLRSGDDELVSLARERVRSVLLSSKSNAEAARTIGIPYRSLCRWLASENGEADILADDPEPAEASENGEVA